MKGRCLLVGLALAAVFGIAGPAEADPPLCAMICDCEESCATECTKIIIIGGEPQSVTVDCDWFGTCIGKSGCIGDCDNQACTSFIYGDGGNNTLNGNANKECIFGYGGNDTMDGNAGDDRIFGDAGTDTGYGDSGNDCLEGGDGDDHLDGESGTDTANGGAGSDVCFAETEVSC